VRPNPTPKQDTILAIRIGAMHENSSSSGAQLENGSGGADLGNMRSGEQLGEGEELRMRGGVGDELDRRATAGAAGQQHELLHQIGLLLLHLHRLR
jgi:hypothetical protein